MLFLMKNAWELGCYLVPGALLGFGLAVLPRRELLGRRKDPARQWLLRAAPEGALTAGWLLLAATLLVRWAGQGLPEPLLLAFCLALDAAALGGVAVWLLRELRLPETV